MSGLALLCIKMIDVLLLFILLGVMQQCAALVVYCVICSKAFPTAHVFSRWIEMAALFKPGYTDCRLIDSCPVVLTHLSGWMDWHFEAGPKFPFTTCLFKATSHASTTPGLVLTLSTHCWFHPLHLSFGF